MAAMSGRNDLQSRAPSFDSSLEDVSYNKTRPTSSPRRWITRPVVILGCVLLIVLLVLGLGLGLGLGLKHKHIAYNHKGPNVIVVMTDDQDLRLDSMSVMPKVNALIGGEGVTYNKHYCTVAICCPSRVNFLTGKAAHNTNVTSLEPPYGGWPKFTDQNLNENYLPVWIQDAGIRTYYVGKFMNYYKKSNMASPKHPQGWTDSNFLIDPWTYNYYHSKWTNGYTDDITPYDGIHTTTVTQTKALAMLDEAAKTKDQFFMMVAPVAPHQPANVPPQYKGVFSNRTAPRTENFNPDEPSGASWVRNLPKLNAKQLKECDKTYSDRLANIAAVDDMMGELIDKLDNLGILDNTYILYTSDNGFHIGNHRGVPDKRWPYEEDVNIPLLVRGPDVAKGIESNITNSHTDIAPTILQMLGVPLRGDFDGAPIAYTEADLAGSTKQEVVNIEFWNMADQVSGHYRHTGLYANNTYKALRLMHNSSSLFYSTWCTGEHEFYDMTADAQQMNNWLGPNPKGTANEYYGRPQSELIPRLDALLMVTKNCKQDTCRDPWGVLFPKGQVSNIQDAMNPSYDTFFEAQPKISFNGCPNGHILADEGPMNVNVFAG